MSLILEALKKLDREKQAPDRGVLVVGPSAWPSASAREGRSARLVATLVMGAVAMAGMGAMLWLLGRPRQAEVPPRPAEAALPPGPRPAQAALPPPRTPTTVLPAPRGRATAGPPSTPIGPSTPTRAPAALPTAARPGSEESPSADSGATTTAGAATTTGAPTATGAATATGSATTADAERSTTPRPGSAAQGPQLQAISSQDGKPVAVLNGQLVREGETIDGMRVVRIGADEVEIEVGGRRRVVKF